MTTTTRTFSVAPPPEAVLDYLEDFARTEEWDPGTESCSRLDTGPVTVGSRWRNVSRFAGRDVELTYTLKERTASRLVFEGSNDSATTVDTIQVQPQGSGSTITYTADVTLHGAAKLATPVVKLLFERLGDETEDQLTAVLDRLGRS